MNIMWLPLLLITGIVPASVQATVSPYRALLDRLGSAPHTVLVKEYELEDGGLGRKYATDLPVDQAPDIVTSFYRDKLLAQRWETLEEHAAVSAYTKGRIMVTISRDGPNDAGLPLKARVLKSATPPANTTLFFEVEAGPRSP